MDGASTNVYRSGSITAGENVVCWLFLIVMMLYRPTIFGMSTTTLAVLASVMLILLFSRKICIERTTLRMTMIVAMFFAYTFIVDYLYLGTLNTDAFKAIISIAAILFFYDALLKNKKYRIKFVKIFIGMLVFFAASCLITNTLTILLRNSEHLLYFDYVNTESGYHMYIYFPFTPAYGRRMVGSFSFVRLTALFRECGITQMFYIWAYAESDYYFRDSKWLGIIKGLLLLGTMFCLSTSGFLNLTIYFALEFVFNLISFDKRKKRRRVLVIILLISITVLSQAIPDMSLSNKNEISLSARTDSYKAMFSLIKSSPVGIIFGYSGVNIESSSLGLLQQIYHIGIVGLLLYAIIPLIAIKRVKDRRRFILANVAGFVTLLFAQPIWMAPIVVLMWVLPYDYIADRRILLTNKST